MAETSYNVNMVFKGVDQASGHVKNIAAAAHGAEKKLGDAHEAAHGMSGALGHAAHILAGFGTVTGIAGAAIGMHDIVHETNEFLSTVKRVSDTTGMVNEKAGGLLATFEDYGISLSESERAMTSMTRAGFRTEMAISAATGQLSGMPALIQRLGIDINKGPEQAFMRMADAAQQNKLTQNELSLAMRVQPEIARKMMNVLKQGPEYLKEEMAEFDKLGIATNKNVMMQEHINAMQIRIKGHWEDMKVIIGTKMLPVIERMMETVEKKMPQWIGYAKSFGTVLGGFLTNHLALILKISKALLVYTTISKVMGKFGMSPGGVLGKAFSFIRGKGGGAHSPEEKAAAALDKLKHAALGAAKALVSGHVFSASYGSKAAGGPVGMLSRAFSSLGRFGPILLRVGGMLLRLTAVGAALAAAYVAARFIMEAWRQISDNVGGLQNRILVFWAMFMARVDVIREMFSGTFERIFGGESVVQKFFVDVIPKVFNALMSAADTIMRTIQVTIGFAQRFFEGPMKVWQEGIGNTWADVAQEVDRRTSDAFIKRMYGVETPNFVETRPAAPKERAGPPQFNFPNAKFDITQKFSEGFDPDRVAVAFTNDLAALGERKVQSGFAPLFGVR